MIRAIIFDCFGVLTTDTWRAFIDSLPENTDIESVREVHRSYDAGLISKSDSAEQIKEITGRTFTELEDAVGQEVVKNNALLDHIRDLREEGYKIGLLSNVASPWITDYFLTQKEQALFDEIVFSYQVGMTKPDPRIYKLICERLGVGTNEAVMVDDIDRYCTAAQAEGMQAIVYKDFAQFKRELVAILPNYAKS